MVLSDSPADARAHGRARARRAACQRRDGTTPRSSLHDFELQAQGADEIEPETLGRLFEDAFARVFRGEVENDDFNRLVLRAGLAADEIVVLRAYAKYLKQIGFALSQATIEATLAAHPRIARMLVALFRLRFDPDERDEQGATAQVNAIEQALEKVANLSEDRVLRQLLALIQATLRTNFWRTGVGHTGAPGPRRSFLSFKFDSARVPGLPEPKPLYEIFVYSPRFEGIHLRGGKVARGGLRWSDRPEDFRTEVLGLVKAQMVKNTVIVPVGSKGGFVLKKAPPASDRDAYLKEGVACYQDYLRGLLDLTDNLAGTTVVPPPQVVRIDGDDPYLVVAADKGTATFSDYANAVSKEYGHWLGDAFASGGSVGYDHKAMGITARGAWESVKRFFREMGVDTQTTAVHRGRRRRHVGRRVRQRHAAVAAHPAGGRVRPPPRLHRPESRRRRVVRRARAPVQAAALVVGRLRHEADLRRRRRLGALGEIDPDLAAGARGARHRGRAARRPTELLSAILKAPVDLLYNGGIGTYVKASTETHADVGDRANDALRINGRELRCKVVGRRRQPRLHPARAHRGGARRRAHQHRRDRQLGRRRHLRPRGQHQDPARPRDQRRRDDREAAQRGAGADDRRRRRAGAARQLLPDAGAVGRRRASAPSCLDQEARFIRFLEKTGRAEPRRSSSCRPTTRSPSARRAALGLTTPERAVLLAYCKMWLFDEIMASDLPEDPWIGTALARYFPALLREKFGAYIPRHPLRREIVATHVLNSMVNRVGSTFVHRLSERTGARAGAGGARLPGDARGLRRRRRSGSRSRRSTTRCPTRCSPRC